MIVVLVVGLTPDIYLSLAFGARNTRPVPCGLRAADCSPRCKCNLRNPSSPLPFLALLHSLSLHPPFHLSARVLGFRTSLFHPHHHDLTKELPPVVKSAGVGYLSRPIYCEALKPTLAASPHGTAAPSTLSWIFDILKMTPSW